MSTKQGARPMAGAGVRSPLLAAVLDGWGSANGVGRTQRGDSGAAA